MRKSRAPRPSPNWSRWCERGGNCPGDDSAQAQRVAERDPPGDVHPLTGRNQTAAEVRVLLPGVHADRLKPTAPVARTERNHVLADRVGAIAVDQLEAVFRGRHHARERAAEPEAEFDR